MSAPEAIRRAIQNSKESIAKLSKNYNFNLKTIVKWRKLSFTKDANMGQKHPKSTVLTLEEECYISQTYAANTRRLPLCSAVYNSALDSL